MLNEPWIRKKLWRESYFSPDCFPDSIELYRCGISGTLLGSLIDGCVGEAVWNREVPLSNTNTLFKRLKTFSRIVGGSSFIYITDPDNALSIIEWERVIEYECSWSWSLKEFEKNPAVEGGVSYLVCAHNDGQSVVVFEKDYDDFTITFYGTEEAKVRFITILNLENKASHSTSTNPNFLLKPDDY